MMIEETISSSPSLKISHRRVTNVILRGIGMVYLFAFIPLMLQIPGLFGRNGLAPADRFLDTYSKFGILKFLINPTIVWISTNDLFLQGTCALGIVLSILLLLGFHRTWIALGTWIIFTSLAAANLTFFRYIWDNFLMEMGFCAVLLTFLRSSSTATLWLIRFLMFRLFFMMGYVKFFSNDPKWKDLLFIKYYLSNQPMPTFISWLLYQLPDLWHKVMGICTLVIEFGCPVFFFTPTRFRTLRVSIFWIYTCFLSILLLSGNYGYFQVLGIVGCISILEDSDLKRIPLLDSIPIKAQLYKVPHNLNLRARIGRAMAVFLTLTGAMWVVHMVERSPEISFCDTTWIFRSSPTLIPKPLIQVLLWSNLWKVSFPYDLFSHIPETRYDFNVQGSMDGRDWVDYGFFYKSSHPDEIAYNVAPFQWRLDHHFFYKALVEGFQTRLVQPKSPSIGFFYLNLGLSNLLQSLVSGNPQVAALFRVNPFKNNPPKYARLLLYEEVFANYNEWRKSGNFWKRTFIKSIQ